MLTNKTVKWGPWLEADCLWKETYSRMVALLHLGVLPKTTVMYCLAKSASPGMKTSGMLVFRTEVPIAI